MLVLTFKTWLRAWALKNCLLIQLLAGRVFRDRDGNGLSDELKLATNFGLFRVCKPKFVN